MFWSVKDRINANSEGNTQLYGATSHLHFSNLQIIKINNSDVHLITENIYTHNITV